MSPELPHSIDTILEVTTRFGITSQLYQSLLARRLAAHDLTPAQLSVLAHLSRRRRPDGTPDAQRITEIAHAVEVRQPAVTKMIAKFAGHGWVRLVATPHDRRARAAQITEAGAAHLRAVQKALIPDLPRWFADWTPEELDAFLTSLTRFSQFLDARRDQGPT